MAPTNRTAPPPQVESSVETAAVIMGTVNSEDETVHSPPSAASKYSYMTPPPQRMQRPFETSDEEEETEESESDEEEEEAPQPKSSPKLSKEVWGGGRPASGTVPRDFKRMCEMYPHLAMEVKELGATVPSLFNRAFCKMDDDKARELDRKFKKIKVSMMKGQVRNQKVIIMVTKALFDLVK